MTAGLRLHEQLIGWWSPDPAPDVGDLGQYAEAAEAGEQAGRVLDLRLILVARDVELLIDDLSTPIVANGTVAAGGLLDEPQELRDGVVQLVVADDAVDPGVEHMRYHLALPEAGLHLDGFKVLDAGVVTQMWGASTTLYVTIRKDGADGPVVGRGIVRLHPGGFARQLASLEITDEDRELRRLALTARFGARFFGALWSDFGTVVQRTSHLRRNAPPRPHRPLDVPVPQVSTYRTDDGVDLRLTRYKGGDRGPVVLVHGMGANPLTYTLDTIQPNLLEYLVAHRFDVWLQEWRGSTALPTAHSQFDADQVARFDHPAAERAVREATGRHDVHWVTHCVGSMTWMMSTLAGWARPASLVLSQVGAHPVAPRLSKIKAGLRAPNVLERLGVRLLTTDSYDDESRGARIVDQLLRLHPVPRAERCDAAVCRRLAFIYGIAVHHAAVDETTHEHLHELFGLTDLRMMAHLAACARAEQLVSATGTDAYLPHVERARLPMTFISGAHNLVWVPESTKRDHDWLVRELGPEGFTRIVLDQHGHQDSFMGAEAYERAFPAVLDHLERAGC
jgi:cholesterol oxidase